MNQDLKLIKKKYGENMMHLCRELFATILDNSPGILPKLLQDYFYPSHYLYEDLIKENCVADFKNYLYNMYDLLNERDENEQGPVASPRELLRQVGYNLYECHTEEEIQAFKKYYDPKEELCTFNGNRLKRCHVYFAVHDDAELLNRRDFPNPYRQDKYGTSVISIQFTRDPSHTLSIKNRYNHTVPNPDATFSNNLDNIIFGLTQSFADYYGMTSSKTKKYTFEIPGYVQANNDKFYKYNYEINNVYYCPDNIIIDNFRVKHYDKEKYLICDYFILDLSNKTIHSQVDDCFPETFDIITKIKIVKSNEEKVVTISQEAGEDIILILDKYNRIINFKNNNLLTINDDFLSYNQVLQEITLDKVTHIGRYFLCDNRLLNKISLPNVIEVGYAFLGSSQLTAVYLPKVEIIDDRFLEENDTITEISLPSVKKIGDNFLRENCKIRKIDLPEVISIGYGFLYWNKYLKTIYLPKVEIIDDCFLEENDTITEISLPSVKKIGDNFLGENRKIRKIDLPEVISIGYGFLYWNKYLKTIYLPKVTEIAGNFCATNVHLETIDLPEVEYIGNRFLFENNRLTRLELPKVTIIDDMCLSTNTKITYISLPKVEQIGINFLIRNLNVHGFYAPNLQSNLHNEYLRQIWTKSSFKTYKLKKK